MDKHIADVMTDDNGINWCHLWYNPLNDTTLEKGMTRVSPHFCCLLRKRDTKNSMNNVMNEKTTDNINANELSPKDWLTKDS